MIVKLDFKDCKGTGVKVMSGEKEITGYMKIVVDRGNIEAAIAQFDKNPRAVAFLFDGTEMSADFEFLRQLCPTVLATPILYQLDLTSVDITRNYLMSLCENIPPAVRLVFKCPDTFTDMATVWEVSKRYPNTSFCGGYLLKIPGCNIGCIRASDIKGRAFNINNPVVQGCGCVMPNITFDEAELTYEYGVVKTPKTTSPAGEGKSKPKRVSTTLYSLGGDALSAF